MDSSQTEEIEDTELLEDDFVQSTESEVLSTESFTESIETIREESITVTPIEESSIDFADYGFIGFGAAGIALIVSLGIASIIRIFWRSAS